MQRRDLILLIKEDNAYPDDTEVKHLHKIIGCIETMDAFCNAHEIVSRNSISNKKGKILKAVQEAALPPFWFLINKN